MPVPLLDQDAILFAEPGEFLPLLLHQPALALRLLGQCVTNPRRQREDRVKFNSRATAPTALPFSITGRTVPALNSSVNSRRARRSVRLDPILDIVSTFRKMSTKTGQAHFFIFNRLTGNGIVGGQTPHWRSMLP